MVSVMICGVEPATKMKTSRNGFREDTDTSAIKIHISPDAGDRDHPACQNPIKELKVNQFSPVNSPYGEESAMSTQLACTTTSQDTLRWYLCFSTCRIARFERKYCRNVALRAGWERKKFMHKINPQFSLRHFYKELESSLAYPGTLTQPGADKVSIDCAMVSHVVGPVEV